MMANVSDQSAGDHRVLTAVRLGWLTVEVFGRLRQYQRSSHTPRERRGDATRRFDFSDRALRQEDALLLAIDQLNYTVAKFGLDLPKPPLPRRDEFGSWLASGLDLDVLQGELDEWSTRVWVALSIEEEAVGRGFTYGGSLADTYWQAEALGPGALAELLRSQRLEYIAARFDSIADHLPPYTAEVLHYTLYQWRYQKRMERLNVEAKKQAISRLEAQAKVWRDLIFGSRRANSFLLTLDRRLIRAGALGATAVLVMIAMLLVWLAVLFLSSAGRMVAASLVGMPQELAAAQTDFIQDLLDWQKWSTLLATLSSVVVLVVGLVTRVSGWLIWFYRWIKVRLKRYRLKRRAYRAWR